MCAVFINPRVRLVWLPGLSPPQLTVRSSQTAEALPTQAGASDNTSSAKAIIFAVGETEDRIRSQIHKASWRRIPAQALWPASRRAPSPAPPAPRYPSLISTAQTRWAASVQPARMHRRRYVNYEALRKLTSRAGGRHPRADGPPPLPPRPVFQVQPRPRRRRAPPGLCQLSGLSARRHGRGRYSLGQIRDMAPSLHSEAPHTGLRDQLLGPRGTLPVPSLLQTLRCERELPAERCLRMASWDVASRAPQHSRI